MCRFLPTLAVVCLSFLTPLEPSMAAAPLEVTMKTLDGESVNLAEKYQGKVVLLVNVASRCGYTRQYKPLQELFEKYADQGLVVVGVPCNQFGGQEPGSESDIATFCEKNYGVTFDMLSKVDVNGPGACDLYSHLTEESPFPGEVGWNFEKFLVSRDGQVVGRFKSGIEPLSDELTKAIEAELAK
jgi:glutathione peroxidase